MLNIATVDTTTSADCIASEAAAQVEILGAVLQDGCCYLDDLGRFLSATSGLFRIGDGQAANNSLAELISGLGLMLQTIGAVAEALGPDLAASLPGNESLEQLMNNLNAVLRDIVHAQERRDLVLLADLLEYELAPHLELWKGIFSALRETLS
jgi:hypothetical protein